MSEPPAAEEAPFPALPTETEIYLLPDGRVVVADLPLELTDLAAALGVAEACEVMPDPPQPPLAVLLPVGPPAADEGSAS